MIDFHSHILPKVDDGSRSVEETVQLLRMLTSQGIHRVVATPHFLPAKESVEEFLSRRETAISSLQQERLPEIKIHLGAEVSYMEGISKIKDITSLRMTGSNLLLLEMPVAKWSEYAVHEIMDLACLPDTQIVLAHVERYRSFQDMGTWQQLLDNDILMQVNARCFLRFATKRGAIKALQKGEIHLLGSDCHDLKVRSPEIGAAYEFIGRKMGETFVSSMLAFGHSLFDHSID